MKRLLALLLALCTCVAVLSSCASCADEDENEKVEVPTAPTEPKEFADAKLASKIKEGMTREEIRKLLKIPPLKYDDKYDRADVYLFDDGRAAYIEYYHNDKENLMNIKIEGTLDPALLDQIKRGYSYDKITEIFGGVKGDMTTSIYWGLYRYVLNDGRLLYINYDGRKFATSISTKNGNGEEVELYPGDIKAFTCDNMEEFKQQLVKNYSGKETKFAVPKLVSTEYEIGSLYANGKGLFFSFVPKDCDEESAEYFNERFLIEIYQIDLTYNDMLDFYKKEYDFEAVEYGDTAAYLGDLFVLNNNGRAIVVQVPWSMSEGNWQRDENSPPAITTLEELEKYLVIEYLDLPGAEE
ncbi:MAG: hypothetical protein J6M03_09005 [Clostridia bacterium]|nr:hypothetical protein [Clostridia bacterium]